MWAAISDSAEVVLFFYALSSSFVLSYPAIVTLSISIRRKGESRQARDMSSSFRRASSTVHHGSARPPRAAISAYYELMDCFWMIFRIASPR
jgi:hypothetical protein